MENFKSKKLISISNIEKSIDGYITFTFSDNFATRKNYDFLECNQLGSHASLFGNLSKEYQEAAQFAIGKRFNQSMTEIDFCDTLVNLFEKDRLEYFIKSIQIVLLRDITEHENFNSFLNKLQDYAEKFEVAMHINASNEPGSFAIKVEASSLVEELEESVKNLIMDLYNKMLKNA